MKSCRNCKSFKDCAGKDWYSWGDIRWCKWQVIWILENQEFFDAILWPPNPQGSCYVDPAVKGRLKEEGYFVKIMITIGIVRNRLNKTGIHGKLLEAEIKANEFQYSPEAYEALMYVKGWREKKTPFSQWLASRNYYKKYNKTQPLDKYHTVCY